MDLTVPSAAASDLAAPFLQGAVTLGLAGLCIFLYHRYRKSYLGYWALAWLLYALRLGAIISFLVTEAPVWLYWHQVATGWTAVALLWAALVFSRQLTWRWRYAPVVLFPPIWSFVAIYQLDNFLLAAGPAVLFLSGATLWTAWAFFRHHRQVGSSAAALLAAAFFLWGLHHLDYPFLRARGAWNPWGYYLDVIFVLAVGGGFLLLLLGDLRRGLAALSAMSRDVEHGGGEGDVLGAVLQRALALPAVRGSAMYIPGQGVSRCLRGAGVCTAWAGTEPLGAAGRVIARVLETGRPEIARDWPTAVSQGGTRHTHAAVLPIIASHEVTGALVLVCAARDPFAALDTEFLVALGRQVGAALANADLRRRLEARGAELERLAARMVEQHEEERRRLSRELHDETAQVFSAVKLQLGMVREASPPGLAPRLDRVLSLVDTGIRSIRSVTWDLRPSLLDDLGLLPALRATVRDFEARSSLPTRFSAPEALPALSDEAELGLFRALQEGLANVARHASANSVAVRIVAADSWIRLEVRDDGDGIPPGAESGEGRMGLVGMRERITALGGTVTVNRDPNGGTRLVVDVPVAKGQS